MENAFFHRQTNIVYYATYIRRSEFLRGRVRSATRCVLFAFSPVVLINRPFSNQIATNLGVKRWVKGKSKTRGTLKVWCYRLQMTCWV
jgi:hypothetical protein